MAKGGWPETVPGFLFGRNADALSGQPPMPGQNKRQQAPILPRACCPVLPADSQFFDDRAIPVDVLLLQIIEKPTPLPYDFEQSTPGVMVLLVSAEMLGKISNPLREKGDLYFRGTGITFVGLEFINDFLLAFRG